MWSGKTRGVMYSAGRVIALFLACVVMFSSGFALWCVAKSPEDLLSSYHNGYVLLLLIIGMAITIIAWAVARQMLFHDEKLKTVLDDQSRTIHESLHNYDQLLHKAEQLSLKEEAKYRSLVEDIGEVIWEIDAETARATYVSPAVMGVLGYAPADVEGGTFEAAMPSPQYGKFMALVQAATQQVQASDDPEFSVTKSLDAAVLLAKSGRTVFFDSTLRFYRNPHGRIIVRGVSRDVTYRKRIEEYQGVSIDSLKILGRQEDFADLLQMLIERLASVSGIDAAGIRLKSGLDYPYAASSGFGSGVLKARCGVPMMTEVSRASAETGSGKAALQGLCGMVPDNASQGGVQLSGNGSWWSGNIHLSLRGATPDLSDCACAAEGFKSVVLTPIRAGGETFGLIHLASRSIGLFTEDMVVQVESIAAHVGDAILRRRIEKGHATLVENLPGTVYRARNAGDGKWTVTFVSDGCTELTGYSPDEFTSGRMSMFMLMKPGNEERVRAEWRSAIAKKAQMRVEYEIATKSGEAKWIWEQSTCIYDAEGNPAEIEGFLSDVTDRIRAEKDRESLRQQLVQSTKMESIGRLAGGVAHDFNNMLQAILGYAEMALYQLPADGDAHGDVVAIQQAAKRAAELTRQLLVFARKSKMNREVVDMNVAVGGLSKMLMRLIGSEVVWDWEPYKEACNILVDPVQLDQIVTNLSINARDALEGKSGGQIEVRAFKRVLTKSLDTHTGPLGPGEYAVLSVKDNGCGISQENLPKLFEPFFTTKQKGKGTGLGLSTAYGVVKACNGGIAVRSEVGRGSTFEVFIPCYVGKAEADPVAVEATCVPKNLGGTGETILLVDDEDAILQTTKRMLCSIGYEVLSTTSPDEAVKLVREHGTRIRLLVTDVIMPGKNGVQLVAETEAIEPDIPHLYMSGYTSNLLVEQGIRSRLGSFISKPFTRDMIAQKIAECLAKRASGAGNT